MPFFGKKPKQPIDFSKIDPPWDRSSKSIYEHIKENIDDGVLTEEGETLPDEKVEEDSIKWVAGGLDGAFGHHSDPGDQNKAAKELFVCLQKALKTAKSEDIAQFYEELNGEGVLSIIDPFMELVFSKGLDGDVSLYSLAKWILKNAPDREAVKASIAILSVSATNDDAELFIDLAKHEEFTLYSAVAIMNCIDDPEPVLLEIAKAVDGWGRIQIVERFIDTESKEVQHWLLTEGYKNSVMLEYTAYVCAVAGDLLEELSKEEVSDEMLVGCAEILSSMNQPGPALKEYELFPTAIELLLEQARVKDLPVSFLTSVSFLKTTLENMKEDDNVFEEQDVSKAELIEMMTEIIESSEWQSKIEKLLESEDDFYIALQAASIIKLDVWDTIFERVKEGGHHWYHLMLTEDVERIKRVVALAQEKIPVDELFTGVDNKTGLGGKFKLYNQLDFVMQELRNFTGIGTDLLVSALKSPVIRNRNMALMAFNTWGKENWPEDLEEKLKELKEIEPNDKTRELLDEMLA